ncbi:hypothetical protein KJ656_11170 [bacterium]|nr:hypothetical protein [bacterium]
MSKTVQHNLGTEGDKDNENNKKIFNRVYPVKCEAIFNGVKKALPDTVPDKLLRSTGQALRSLSQRDLFETGQASPALPR